LKYRWHREIAFLRTRRTPETGPFLPTRDPNNALGAVVAVIEVEIRGVEAAATAARRRNRVPLSHRNNSLLPALP